MSEVTVVAVLVLVGGFLLLLLSHYVRYKRLFGAQRSAELYSRDFSRKSGFWAEWVLRSRQRRDYSGAVGTLDSEGIIRRRNAVKLAVRRTVAAVVIGLVIYYIFFSRSTKAAAAIIVLLVIQEVVKRLTKPEEIRESGKSNGTEEAREASVEREEPTDIWVEDEEGEKEEEDWGKEKKEEGDYKSGWDSRL